MTVYNSIADYYGLPVGDGPNNTSSFLRFVLCAEDTNGYVYTGGTGYSTNHTRDKRQCTRTGGQTVSGTWTLSNTNVNLGTTALPFPVSGYFRDGSISNHDMQEHSFGCWIYFDTLPTLDIFFAGVTNSSALNFQSGNIYEIKIGLTTTGNFRFQHRDSTNLAYDYTSVATIPTSTWTYVTVAHDKDNAYVGINGVVTTVPAAFQVTSRFTGLYAGIKTDADINATGLIIDDLMIIGNKKQDWCSNFSVPTTELETELTTNQISYYDRADYVTSNAIVAEYYPKDISDDGSLIEDALLDNTQFNTANPFNIGTVSAYANPLQSSSFANILGITYDSTFPGRIEASSEKTGSPRPSTGIMFPRGS